MLESRRLGPILLIALGATACLLAAGLRHEPLLLGALLLLIAGLVWYGRFPADRGW